MKPSTERERAVVEAIRASLDGIPRREIYYQNNPHPLAGYCYVAAEACYHLLGGKRAGYLPVRCHFWQGADRVTHWWLEHQDGTRIDPTAEQFGPESPSLASIYSFGIGGGFLTRKPSRRAALVIKRAQEKLA